MIRPFKNALSLFGVIKRWEFHLPPKPLKRMARVWRDRDRDCGGELRAVANQLTGVVQLCGAGSAFAALRQVAGAFFFLVGVGDFWTKIYGWSFFGGVS